MDSGKLRGGQKPNFSQTCSLLSQYLKEKGSFGDLSLRLSNNYRASTNLVPQLTSVTNGESEKGQMTIFYGGQVIVFDEFPAERVKEIITMANVGQQSAEPAASNLGNFNYFVNNLAQPMLNANDLPIARNASLARFLEKRKDRLTAKTPYQTSSTGATSKRVDERKGKPWLGLGAQPPTKIEHHA